MSISGYFGVERVSRCLEWVCFFRKMCLFFCAYLIRIKKRNNFVEEFFSIQAFFFEKTQFENSTKTIILSLWRKVNLYCPTVTL
jgi:hypothetical protein